MGSCGTPVIVGVNNKQQLIANGYPNVIAYDPENGRELWRSEGPSGVIVHSPVFGAGMLFTSVGHPGKKVFGIRLNPTPSQDRLVWAYNKGTGYVPSPLFYQGYLYLMSDSSVLTCLDAKTGDLKYAERLPDSAGMISSLAAFDGKILLTTQEGDTYVIKAGPEFCGRNGHDLAGACGRRHLYPI